MFKIGWLGQHFPSIAPGLGSVIIGLALAESALGSPHELKMPEVINPAPQLPAAKQTGTPPKPEPVAVPLSPDRFRPSLNAADPSPNPLPSPDAPPVVVNVETLQPEPVVFETAAGSLQGGTESGQPTVEVPLPAIAPPDLAASETTLNTTAEPPNPFEPPVFEVTDYVPEPEPTTVATVSTAVDTAPDDRVEWRATLWGGVMTDNYWIDSVTFQNVELENSGFLGVGVSRTVGGGNTIKVEGELQLLRHTGRQEHFEGTAALALRWQMSPSFSLALVEGVSYATDLPEIEDDNNTDESQFLNYLAFEVEYSYTSDWAIAGRLHHRSGAFQLFGNATGGSNAYLFGVRHRF